MRGSARCCGRQDGEGVCSGGVAGSSVSRARVRGALAAHADQRAAAPHHDMRWWFALTCLSLSIPCPQFVSGPVATQLPETVRLYMHATGAVCAGRLTLSHSIVLSPHTHTQLGAGPSNQIPAHAPVLVVPTPVSSPPKYLKTLMRLRASACGGGGWCALLFCTLTILHLSPRTRTPTHAARRCTVQHAARCRWPRPRPRIGEWMVLFLILIGT